LTTELFVVFLNSIAPLPHISTGKFAIDSEDQFATEFHSAYSFLSFGNPPPMVPIFLQRPRATRRGLVEVASHTAYFKDATITLSSGLM